MSSSEVLSLFHPLVRDWFADEFGEPTDPQALGWPAIARGQHTLIAAPTGSGKTLAAFLLAVIVYFVIDWVLRRLTGRL